MIDKASIEPPVLIKNHEAKASMLLSQKDFKDGVIIESAVFIPKITVAFGIWRHVTLMLSLRMKTCRVRTQDISRWNICSTRYA
jgi:hypothetical protein